MRFSGENLHGRAVIASDGLAIGGIILPFLDSEAWRAESLQVKLHDDVADRLSVPAHQPFAIADAGESVDPDPVG